MTDERNNRRKAARRKRLAEIDKLRDALTFYADQSNYDRALVALDGGARARAALASVEPARTST